MAFRDVVKLVTDASKHACAAKPRTLTFRPVHDGPAEIAAPLKLLPEEGAGGDGNPEVRDTDGEVLDMDEEPKAEVTRLPPGVEILPHGGFDVTEAGYVQGYVQPMYSTSRVPAPLIRWVSRDCWRGFVRMSVFAVGHQSFLFVILQCVSPRSELHV